MRVEAGGLQLGMETELELAAGVAGGLCHLWLMRPDG